MYACDCKNRFFSLVTMITQLELRLRRLVIFYQTFRNPINRPKCGSMLLVKVCLVCSRCSLVGYLSYQINIFTGSRFAVKALKSVFLTTNTAHVCRRLKVLKALFLTAVVRFLMRCTYCHYERCHSQIDSVLAYKTRGCGSNRFKSLIRQIFPVNSSQQFFATKICRFESAFKLYVPSFISKINTHNMGGV